MIPKVIGVLIAFSICIFICYGFVRIVEWTGASQIEAIGSVIAGSLMLFIGTNSEIAKVKKDVGK
jgi:hypothetical protein